MKRVEFEQILDNTRKSLEKITKIEEVLEIEMNSLCNPLCNIIDVLADNTKAKWDDELWSRVYDYSISTTDLVTQIEEYSIKDRETRGEEGVKIFDEE